jgi:hypothetical protein
VSRIIAAFLRLGMAVSAPHAASAQGTPGAPAVGVVEVAKRSITEKTELMLYTAFQRLRERLKGRFGRRSGVTNAPARHA